MGTTQNTKVVAAFTLEGLVVSISLKCCFAQGHFVILAFDEADDMRSELLSDRIGTLRAGGPVGALLIVRVIQCKSSFKLVAFCISIRLVAIQRFETLL
jgi:hypothetical protein